MVRPETDLTLINKNGIFSPFCFHHNCMAAAGTYVTSNKYDTSHSPLHCFAKSY